MMKGEETRTASMARGKMGRPEPGARPAGNRVLPRETDFPEKNMPSPQPESSGSPQILVILLLAASEGTQ